MRNVDLPGVESYFRVGCKRQVVDVVANFLWKALKVTSELEAVGAVASVAAALLIALVAIDFASHSSRRSAPCALEEGVLAKTRTD